MVFGREKASTHQLQPPIANIGSRLADPRGAIDHQLYADSLFGAAVIGLDGSVEATAARQNQGTHPPPPAGPVSAELAQSRLDSMRNGLLMALEQKVKDGELTRVAVQAILFMGPPWLLLLLPMAG